MRTKNKTTKLISALLIITIFLPSLVFLTKPNEVKATVPVIEVAGAGVWSWITSLFSGTTSTSTVTDTGLHIKDFAKEVARQVLMAVARAFLQKMTQSIVTWINSGFHGNPLYLENSESFFKDIAKYEIRNVIDTYGYDDLLYPFGKDFALNTLYAYKNTTANNAAYSLSKVFNDPVLLRNYQNDFNYGGWNAFLINTQYPQNNYLGFQMLVTEELARKVQGLAQTAGEEVQTTLAQGQGFLSPKTCQTNPNYNKDFSEFKPPVFKSTEDIEDYVSSCDAIEDADQANACYAAGEAEYDEAVAAEKADWSSPEKGNVCPPRADGSGGLVATTPGSVVADQIKNAMGSQFRQSELAAAMGNSIAAIVDALVNKFISDGLSSLSGSGRSNPQADTWNYNGITLGGTATVTGYNDDIWSTPDQIIVLEEFKQKVNEGIEKTKRELLMMDNRVPTPENGPGIAQVIAMIWPKVQTLDICQPGPDLNWQVRTDREMSRNSANFQSGDITAPPSGDILNQINLNTAELQFAVDFFKDWTSGQLLDALPSSVEYVDEITGLRNLSQQYNELKNEISRRKSALAQLENIGAALDTNFSNDTQPEAGSAAEGQLVSLWKQYEAVSLDVSNDTTLEATISELNSTIFKKNQLDEMITQCGEERTAKGWAVPGGATSQFLGSGGGTEQIIFCDAPIVGGYSHEDFINPSEPDFPEIPLINAQNILIGTESVDVELSCSIIFRASVLDYKGDLPGF